MAPENKCYICNYCEKVFRLKTRLVTHITTHEFANNTTKMPNTASKSGLTKSADLISKKKRTLQIKKEKTDTKIITRCYYCPLCDYKTTCGNHRLKVHMITHTDLKPFTCVYCDYVCNNSTNMKRHTLTHAEATLLCSFCQKKFKRLDRLEHHMKLHDELTGGIAKNIPMQDLTEELLLVKSNYICNSCGKAFKSKTLLISHIQIHNIQIVDAKTKSSKRKHPCVTCKGTFATQSDLINHNIRIHNFKVDYKSCTICDFKTILSNRLAVHMQMHFGLKPFKCTQCKYESTSGNDLKIHTRIHTGEKPFECTYCYARFAQKNSLKHHMNTHTGSKPHICTICDAAFAQPSGLRRHRIIHTGDKPYKCTICNKAYSDSSALKRHEKTHTRLKPYACTDCGRKFTSNQNLKKHARIHRPI